MVGTLVVAGEPSVEEVVSTTTLEVVSELETAEVELSVAEVDSVALPEYAGAELVAGTL
jgi:hypothetical protein